PPDQEDDGVGHPRAPGYQLGRRIDRRAALDRRLAVKERLPENRRGVERMPGDRVDEQEPDRDDRRADEPRTDALQVDGQGDRGAPLDPDLLRRRRLSRRLHWRLGAP